jgi:hypothetical protein
MSKAPKVTMKRPKSNKVGRTVKISGHQTLSDDMTHWWDQDESNIANCIAGLVQRIDDNNYNEREQFMRFARMYGNYEALGYSNITSATRSEQTSNRPVYNIIQSCVDTVHSKVARDNPQPYFITSGADYFDKLKAENMTKFCQGVFEVSNFYQIANNKVFRDASVYGLGAVQWEICKDGMPKCEWVFIDELKIDKYDAQRGLPLSMHRVKMMQKERLIEKYKDKEELILETCTTHPNIFRTNDTVVDFVVIVESWHLKVGDKVGKHCVILADQILLNEDYDEDFFPIVVFPYYEKVAGIYGRGITETILSGQIEINKILMFIQQCQELQCSPYLVVDSASEISEDVILSNQVSRMIPYRNGTQPPQFISPQGSSEEVYSHLNSWMSWCYQEVGVSQTSAGGEKQPGVTSAVAMRTMVDVESSRFIQVSKNWEKFMVDNAEVVIKMGQKAWKGKKFKVNYLDKKAKMMKEMEWDKINLPADMFTIKCDTVSAFPASAAGRIQTITDFISNQFLSKERGMELLGLDPDLEDEIKLQTSSLRLTEKRLCQMVEDGIYYHPEKYLNLKLALSISEATYNQLCIDNCPEEQLALVRLWIREITVLLSGSDPEVQQLQDVFNPAPPPQPGAIAPQAGMAPARMTPPPMPQG